MNVKLVGVSVEELEMALRHSGLILRQNKAKGEPKIEIRAIPNFIQDNKQRPTTLEFWEKIGEHQQKLAKIKEALEEI